MLYLVATPIGNLEDITLRALRILQECDYIYAEDTRHTLPLLRHFNIEKPLHSCHQHNEKETANKIAHHIQNGKIIALVSDAGLPGISDPGMLVVQTFIEQNLPFTVLPGACAMTTALILSGFPADDFVFTGFLSRENKKRNQTLAGLQKEKRTIILYESPYRIAQTCGELAELFGDSPAALCRELTKLHEECVRDTLLNLAKRYREQPPKGECVIVIDKRQTSSDDTPEDSISSALSDMMTWIHQGQKPKQAAKLASTESISANSLYQAYIASKNNDL